MIWPLPSFLIISSTPLILPQTTIMAASYDGGVVMGADSRTSTGAYVANRVTDKITSLAENIYICRSGSAADTQNLSRYVQYFIEQHRMELGEDPQVKTAAMLAQSMAYQNKVGWSEKKKNVESVRSRSGVY
jgi:20S proteasome alpha/beta subunit